MRIKKRSAMVDELVQMAIEKYGIPPNFKLPSAAQNALDRMLCSDDMKDSYTLYTITVAFIVGYYERDQMGPQIDR